MDLKLNKKEVCKEISKELFEIKNDLIQQQREMGPIASLLTKSDMSSSPGSSVDTIQQNDNVNEGLETRKMKRKLPEPASAPNKQVRIQRSLITNSQPELEWSEVGLEQLKATLGSTENIGNFNQCLRLYKLRMVYDSEFLNMATTVLSPDYLCGPSYRVITGAKTDAASKSSHQTDLCSEVLNDVYRTLPFSYFSSNYRKHTNVEIYMEKLENQRFERDLKIEIFVSTIRYLRNVAQNISEMSPTQLQTYEIENRLLHDDSFALALEGIHKRKLESVIESLTLLRNSRTDKIPIVLEKLQKEEERLKINRETFNESQRKQMKRHFPASAKKIDLVYNGSTSELQNVHKLNVQFELPLESLRGLDEMEIGEVKVKRKINHPKTTTIASTEVHTLSEMTTKNKISENDSDDDIMFLGEFNPRSENGGESILKYKSNTDNSINDFAFVKEISQQLSVAVDEADSHKIRFLLGIEGVREIIRRSTSPEYRRKWAYSDADIESLIERCIQFSSEDKSDEIRRKKTIIEMMFNVNKDLLDNNESILTIDAHPELLSYMVKLSPKFVLTDYIIEQGYFVEEPILRDDDDNAKVDVDDSERKLRKDLRDAADSKGTPGA